MNLITGRVLPATLPDRRQPYVFSLAAGFSDNNFTAAFTPALPLPAKAPYTDFVFARKLRVEITVGAEHQPCPIEWLDNFCMRNFTGQTEFDDTLPVADGLIEAGFHAQPERLAEAMQQWFTRRGKGSGEPVRVRITPA